MDVRASNTPPKSAVARVVNELVNRVVGISAACARRRCSSPMRGDGEGLVDLPGSKCRRPQGTMSHIGHQQRFDQTSGNMQSPRVPFSKTRVAYSMASSLKKEDLS